MLVLRGKATCGYQLMLAVRESDLSLAFEAGIGGKRLVASKSCWLLFGFVADCTLKPRRTRSPFSFEAGLALMYMKPMAKVGVK